MDDNTVRKALDRPVRDGKAPDVVRGALMDDPDTLLDSFVWRCGWSFILLGISLCARRVVDIMFLFGFLAGHIWREKRRRYHSIPPPFGLCRFVQINDKTEPIADCKQVRIIRFCPHAVNMPCRFKA